MVLIISALLFVSVKNLHHIHVVQAALLAVPLLYRLVEHLLRTNLRLVQLATCECEACFIECYAAVLGCNRCEMGLLRLIEVSARLSTAERIRLACLLRVAEENKVHRVVSLNELVGVTLRTDVHNSHWAVPQPAKTAPRGCHHIELLFVACSNEHPLLTNSSEHIIVECRNVNLFHNYFFFKRSRSDKLHRIMFYHHIASEAQPCNTSDMQIQKNETKLKVLSRHHFEPLVGFEPTTPRLQITCSGQLS